MCKVAFHLGSLTIYWYGIFVAIGIVAGLWTASRFSIRKNLSPDIVVDSGVWLILGGIAGARIYYVFANWHEVFSNQPWYEVFMIQKGGLVYYGGLIGGIFGAFLYTKFKGIPLLRFFDVLAIGLPVGHVFGRIGCFMNGCCYGKNSDFPLAVHFPLSHETGGAGVHPTQLYESGLNLLLFFWLARYFKRTSSDGFVTSCYLMSYSVLRFFVEFLRGDYPQNQLIVGGAFTPAQGLSVIIFALGFVMHILVKRQTKSA